MRSALLIATSLLLLSVAAASADSAAKTIRPGTWRFRQLQLHGLVRPHAPPEQMPSRADAAQMPGPQLNFTILDFPGSTMTYLGFPNLGAIPHAKNLAAGSYIPGSSGTGARNGMLLT